MSATELLILFIISLIANLLSALAGGGAGLLQLPALLFLGLPFPTALATHKIASVALGVGASIRHWQSEKLDVRFSLFILAAGLPGVWLGTQVILDVPEHWAKLALGILTIGIGVYSLFKPNLGQKNETRTHSFRELSIGCSVLFIIGVLNGSLTSGTGLFVTLWLIRWFGFDFTRAVAYTLILVGIFWNGVGALFLAQQTTVAWTWLPPLLLGSLVGGYAGAHWALLKGNKLVKRSFELITIAVGSHLVISSFMH
ncbi:MAG: sulfite exporter TauE/SafE family protein [Agitococcus sp.]|nr:sulfite exporter TauE/SafE family protein [Agitococcus sp.]